MTDRAHWHVGGNVPGYLPETGVYCVADAVDALDVLRGELRWALDGVESDEEFLIHDTRLHVMTRIPDNVDLVYFDVFDGRALPVRYWAQWLGGCRAECELADNDE